MRTSEVFTTPPQETMRGTTPSIVPKGALPLSANLTITTPHRPKQGEKNYARFPSNMLAPPDGAYSLPSQLSTLLQILKEREHERCNS